MSCDACPGHRVARRFCACTPGPPFGRLAPFTNRRARAMPAATWSVAALASNLLRNVFRCILFGQTPFEGLFKRLRFAFSQTVGLSCAPIGRSIDAPPEGECGAEPSPNMYRHVLGYARGLPYGFSSWGRIRVTPDPPRGVQSFVFGLNNTQKNNNKQQTNNKNKKQTPFDCSPIYNSPSPQD